MRREKFAGRTLPATDAAVAAIAGAQHGLVTTAQLVGLGLDSAAIRRRVVAGRLHRLHRGVFAVGHRAPRTEQAYLAAVLACGEGAALSHFGAADLWRLWENARRPVDVTVATQNGRSRRAGIRVHRSATVVPGDVSRHRGIPVTTVQRTLKDLRPLLPRSSWLRAAHQALVRHAVAVELRDPLTLSRNERRLLAICRRHRLPMPETNALVRAASGRQHRADAVWRDASLVVEVDGFEVHASRWAFEHDREVQADLEDAGLRVLRIADAQLADGSLVARRIRARLG